MSKKKVRTNGELATKKAAQIDMSITTTDVVALNVARIEQELESQKKELEARRTSAQNAVRAKESEFNEIDYIKKNIDRATFRKNPWGAYERETDNTVSFWVIITLSGEEHDRWKAEMKELHSQLETITKQLNEVECKLRNIPRMEREARAKFAAWKLEKAGFGDLTKLTLPA